MIPQKFGVADCVAGRAPMVKGLIMRQVLSVLSVVAIAVWADLAAVPASAADLSDHPVLDEASLLPQEIGTGWYLRGDVGYSFNDAATLAHGGIDFAGLDAKDGFVGTIGFGYQFNDMVRVDLTVDKLNGFDVTGSATCAAWSTCGAGPTGERATAGVLAVMANAYVDLGTWHGITPYVGAGVGAAYVDVTRHQSSDAGSSSPDRTFAGYETWALAANLAAGASYTVAEGLMVDLGYRFLWVDGGRSGASATEPGHVEVKDLTAHQIRAGLRYYLF